MIISSQLLREIADPTLTRDKRARLRCRLAKELEDAGSYDAARKAMGELWPEVEGRPVLDELSEEVVAEVVFFISSKQGTRATKPA
jgi:hypothetical protein